MASITIREQDLTTATNTDTTANVVYVPGYATMGPTNVPTLCSTVSEFQSTFGYLPYQFKHSASGPDGSNVAYEKDDYEKSYRYALELLKAGLPVYFERFTPSSDYLPFATSKLYFDTKEYDAYVNISDIEYSTTLTTENKNDNTILTVALKTPIKENDAFTIIDESLTISIGSYIFTYTGTIEESNDTAEQLEFTCTAVDGDILATYTNTELVLTVPSVLEDVSSITEAEVAYGINTRYLVIKSASNGDYLIWKLYDSETDTLIDNINAILSGSTLTYAFELGGITFTGDSTVQVKTVENKATNANYITLQAKYQGSYAADCLKITSAVTTKDGVDYTYLTALFTVNNKTDIESSTISLDKNDANYYKLIENPYFDIIEVNIDRALIDNNLIRVKEVEEQEFTYSSDTDEEFNIETFYSSLSDMLDVIKDRAEYTIKFITTGGYPVFWNRTDQSLVNKLMSTAADRGDAIALIDPIDIEPSKLYTYVKERMSESIVSDLGEDIRKYGAMFTPWAKYSMQTADETESFPGSFAYLKCLALSTKTNADWLAVSGVTRGLVPNLLELNQKVTGSIADQLQQTTGISINPIMNIKPYGYCIWGNRTLYNNLDGLTASSFLNIKVLTSNIKKVLYTAAKKLTFELNSDILWLNFKAAIEPTLDQMKSGSGISDYKITKVATTKKATIEAKIRIYPIEAVEDWDITVELSDTTTSIE